MKITSALLAEIVKLEVKMDQDRQPYVTVKNQIGRWAFSLEVLEACNITPGSEISNEVLLRLMQFNLTRLEEEIAYRNGQKLVSEVLHDRKEE